MQKTYVSDTKQRLAALLVLFCTHTALAGLGKLQTQTTHLIYVNDFHFAERFLGNRIPMFGVKLADLNDLPETTENEKRLKRALLATIIERGCASSPFGLQVRMDGRGQMISIHVVWDGEHIAVSVDDDDQPFDEGVSDRKLRFESALYRLQGIKALSRDGSFTLKREGSSDLSIWQNDQRVFRFTKLIDFVSNSETAVLIVDQVIVDADDSPWNQESSPSNFLARIADSQINGVWSAPQEWLALHALKVADLDGEIAIQFASNGKPITRYHWILAEDEEKPTIGQSEDFRSTRLEHPFLKVLSQP